MQQDQRVSGMALEVLARQASTRSNRIGEPFEEALEAVLETEAGRWLRKLSEGPQRYESAHQWQQELPQKRAKERRQTRREERRQAQQEEQSRARLVAWEAFMQAERREMELRKNGQLAKMLGEPLPGEPPAEMLRLASEDRRQAEEGLVALMSNGEVFYKHLEELSEWDMPARNAATNSRTAWLKERQEVRWFGRETG
jgi:cellobiose-specific phosphotransferase system component IIA